MLRGKVGGCLRFIKMSRILILPFWHFSRSFLKFYILQIVDFSRPQILIFGFGISISS